MKRLNNQNISLLSENVRTPLYSRDKLETKIVHLGVGNFHRAHQALFTETANNAASVATENQGQYKSDWGICGVSLRRPDMRNKLAPQDNLYTVEVRNNDEHTQQVVGAIKEMLVASEDKNAVINKLANASIQIITLTVTEKAYYLNADGNLNLDHEDIQRDLVNPEDPSTVIGYLAAGLRQRRLNNSGPVTVICCDNLSNNGRKLEAAVLTFLSRCDPESRDWLAANTSFPDTMVDRIVPSTTEEDITSMANAIGQEDLAPIATEPFCQWVIEKNFVTDIPDWQGAGALLVDEVAPFENIKLRMLNGSHSTLAYLGCLAGFETVAEAMADEDFYQLLERLMRDEVQSTLDVPEGFDINGYRQQLLDRFSNTAIQHQLRQIAMDGSQKLPQRLLPPLRERISNGQDTQCLTLAIAAWIRFSRGLDGNGELFTLEDPLADKLSGIHLNAGPNVDSYLSAIVNESGIFDEELQRNESILKQLHHWLNLIENDGAREAVASLKNAD